MEEQENVHKEQKMETKPAPEKRKTNKAMLIVIGITGVSIIAAGAFFLTRSQSLVGLDSDTTTEQDSLQDDSSIQEGSTTNQEGMTNEEMMRTFGDSNSATNSGEEEVATDEAMMETQAREITVSGFSFGYEPSTLTVEAGEEIELTFVSEDTMHDFVIEGTDIATEVIQGGEQTIIEFTAPEEPGEYTFYCSVGNHRALGMEGTLIVE
jgi:plastocyanin